MKISNELDEIKSRLKSSFSMKDWEKLDDSFRHIMLKRYSVLTGMVNEHKSKIKLLNNKIKEIKNSEVSTDMDFFLKRVGEIKKESLKLSKLHVKFYKLLEKNLGK